MRVPGAALLLLAGLGAVGLGAVPPASNADCIACRADAAALRESYSEAEWTELLADEVITSEAGGENTPEAQPRTVSASGRIAASPEQAWSVITDHAAYPRFMPTVEETRVRALPDGRVSVVQHLRVLFVDVRYATLWTLDPARGLATWQLDESEPHDIAATTGSWQLAVVPGLEGVLVRYRAVVDTGRPVPGPIERWLTRSSLPRVVRSVREEVERRRGR